MRSVFALLLFIFLSEGNFSQQNITLTRSDIVELHPELAEKLLSGDLLKAVSEKNKSAKINNLRQPEKLPVVIYQHSYPSNEQLNHYYSLGVTPYTETWTPPLQNHPYGFFLAELPSDKLVETLSLPFLVMMDYADGLAYPAGNESVKKTNAKLIFPKGYKGRGVKVAVLDSGLDTEPLNQDLPLSIIKKDYSAYPTLDDDVENTVTGHGTHVTGLLAGNGLLSEGNTGNGSGSYSGTAPGVDLVFLKIGNDFSGGASTTSIVMALDAAVNIYGSKIITMSYGSWDTFHDGSSTQDQKVDWCYTNGTAVFLAAGNLGDAARHYSGYVNANDSTGYIRVNANNVTFNSTYLNFNLVWYDGLILRNNLVLKYYDSAFNEITESYSFPTTQSIRGTESKISQLLYTLPEGNSIYYLRVINQSPNAQNFHIYEHFKNGKVIFDNPDPDYSIVSPATADYAFCVGAYVSRDNWTAFNGLMYSYSRSIDDIATFSSRGPRIDGTQKPDLVAPGSALISIRDRDIYTTQNEFWIDNDGSPTGESNYYVMEGTSMAAPVTAGCAALILSIYPTISPQQLYNALRDNSFSDLYTGNLPNYVFGYGKLNALGSVNDSSLIASYTVALNVKLFIEGAFNGTNLSNFLVQNNLVPDTHPYNTANIYYDGEEFVHSFSSSTVDWVLVQLKKITGNDTLTYTKAALLNAGGMITETDGSPLLRFYNVHEDDYYISVKHRNHLRLISSITVHLGSDSGDVYDFTSSPSNSLNSDAMILLSDGVWGAAAGDINTDEQVNAHDMNSIWNLYNSNGYKWPDVNFDGIVDDNDKQLVWKNRNIFSVVN